MQFEGILILKCHRGNLMYWDKSHEKLIKHSTVRAGRCQGKGMHYFHSTLKTQARLKPISRKPTYHSSKSNLEIQKNFGDIQIIAFN